MVVIFHLHGLIDVRRSSTSDIATPTAARSTIPAGVHINIIKILSLFMVSPHMKSAKLRGPPAGPTRAEAGTKGDAGRGFRCAASNRRSSSRTAAW